MDYYLMRAKQRVQKRRLEAFKTKAMKLIIFGLILVMMIIFIKATGNSEHSKTVCSEVYGLTAECK